MFRTCNSSSRLHKSYIDETKFPSFSQRTREYYTQHSFGQFHGSNRSSLGVTTRCNFQQDVFLYLGQCTEGFVITWPRWVERLFFLIVYLELVPVILKNYGCFDHGTPFEFLLVW
mmetsp:Transcript_116248/g.333847  ORF Transcript_116248/g.333847 Transcript_116248/m.333847 type:complete len:115 (-) Transcript_116248:338-682(-)